MTPIRFFILTVSDRSSRGERPDLAGPALAEAVAREGHQVVKTAIVPDEQTEIEQALIRWSDQDHAEVILTTGGTGFAPRDVTPEATLAVIQKQALGLAEAMRARSLQVTPHGMLSRSVAGIRGKTLIINLPGSPKGALENLQTILPVLPHAVELLQEAPSSEAGHAAKPD
jgi:molybdenum cofactor synthesis domain-containing protein